MPFARKKGERFGGGKRGTPNKSTAEIRALAQVYGPAAINKLATLMQKSQDETIQRLSAKDLLERGYGKPMQTQHYSGTVGTYDASKLAALSLPELKAFEAILIRIAPGAPASGSDQGGDS